MTEPAPPPKPKPWRRICIATILLALLIAAALFFGDGRDPQWSPSRSDGAGWIVVREPIFKGWLGQVTDKYFSRNSVIGLYVVLVIEAPDRTPPLPGAPRRMRRGLSASTDVRNPKDVPLPIIIQSEINWLGAQTQISSLYLTNADLQNLDLAPLANLRHLETLYLSMTGLHDKDMAWLSKLTRLRKLYLYDLDATADTMDYMAPLINIEDLLIDTSKVTDEQLAWVSNLDNLRIAKFPNLGITGACLDNLRHPEKIIRITLTGGHPSPQFLSNLNRFTGLKLFWVGNTTFNDQDLKHLLNLPSLEVINLGNTQVTGPGLKTLHAIKTLTKIRVMTAFNEKYPQQLKDFINATTAQIEIIDGPTPSSYLQGSRLRIGPSPAGVTNAR